MVGHRAVIPSSGMVYRPGFRARRVRSIGARCRHLHLAHFAHLHIFPVLETGLHRAGLSSPRRELASSRARLAASSHLCELAHSAASSLAELVSPRACLAASSPIRELASPRARIFASSPSRLRARLRSSSRRELVSPRARPSASSPRRELASSRARLAGCELSFGARLAVSSHLGLSFRILLCSAYRMPPSQLSVPLLFFMSRVTCYTCTHTHVSHSMYMLLYGHTHRISFLVSPHMPCGSQCVCVCACVRVCVCVCV